MPKFQKLLKIFIIYESAKRFESIEVCSHGTSEVCSSSRPWSNLDLLTLLI